MHGLNERVMIDQLKKCEDIYFRLIQSYTDITKDTL